MDPKDCLRRIFDSIEDRNSDETVEGVSDLLCWILRGGEVPIIDSAQCEKLSKKLYEIADDLY